MSDTDRLHAFVAIVKKMRAAQRDYWNKGRTTVVEAKRLEAACDRWIEDNGFAEQRTMFASGRESRVKSREPAPGSTDEWRAWREEATR